jgi:hypothetical protein
MKTLAKFLLLIFLLAISLPLTKGSLTPLNVTMPNPTINVSLPSICYSNEDCVFCGQTCVSKYENLICPLVLPPKGYKCICVYGACTKAPDVKLLLKTDKSVYKKGETVTILVKNVGEIPLKLSSNYYDYFKIYYEWSNKSAGGVKNVYPYDCEWMRSYKPEIVLQPGESKVFEWNQNICPSQLSNAPPGEYSVEVEYRAVNDEIIDAFCSIDIEKNISSCIPSVVKIGSIEFKIAPEISLKAWGVCSNGIMKIYVRNEGPDSSNEITVKSGINSCTISPLQPNSQEVCRIEGTAGKNLVIINTTGYTLNLEVECEEANVSKEVVEKVMNYINSNLIPFGTRATLVAIKDRGAFYEIITSYLGKEIPVYATKDGKYLFMQLVILSESVENQAISKEEVGERVVRYINTHLVAYGTNATLVEIKDVGLVYEIITSYLGRETSVYATKDGKYMFLEAIGLSEKTEVCESGMRLISFDYNSTTNTLRITIYNNGNETLRLTHVILNYADRIEAREISGEIRPSQVIVKAIENVLPGFTSFKIYASSEHCPNIYVTSFLSTPSQPSTSTTLPVNKTKLLGVLPLLEQLKVKLNELKNSSRSIAEYYDKTNNEAKSTCWKEVTMMLEALVLKTESMKSEIEIIKDSPTQEGIEKIKGMVKEIRSNIGKIVDKIFEC